MDHCSRSAWLLLLLLTNSLAWAGGSGLNVVVVVNQNSTNSVQLGNDYCEKRGVPPENVFRMTDWTNGPINWSVSDFEAHLRDPLLAMLANRNLTNQIDFVLLSMDIPYRIVDNSGINSTTAMLFYGFKPDDTGPGSLGSCSLPDLSSNSYCYSELPFSQARPNTATTNSFLAMMLTDTNLAAAERILASGLASDSSYPTQTIYLEKTGFWANNVRYLEFDNATFESRIRGVNVPIRIDSDSTSFTNLFGFSTGLATFSMPAEAFVPGSVADTLTSFGGYILEDSGQTPLLAFLEAGASGSYGTVVEPCNYLEKFPDPVVYFYQQRGFCLAESYYQSLLNPYQGLLVGEPLSAPYAIRGAADWSSLTNGAVFSGVAPLNLTFSSGAATAPLDQVDLFIDGAFFQTLTNVSPTAGNVLQVVLNGSAVNYTVPSGATLASTAAGLTTAINAQTNATLVQAFPSGDRFQLQSLNLATPGSETSLTANVSAGNANAVTVELTPSRSNFLDTIATGYVTILITNSAGPGDWLQFAFVKTNGTPVTLAVTNTAGSTNLPALVQNLFTEVNSDPELQSTDGCYAGDLYVIDNLAQFFIYARSPGWAAAQAQLTLTSSSNLGAITPMGTAPLEDNISDLRPRNHLYLSAGVTNLAVGANLDTRQLADGFHELTAVAYGGSSVRTQTRISRTVQVQNTPLKANFSALVAGANVTFETPLQFAVSANQSNISQIELLSTGGLVGVVSNQANAVITAPSATLGLGLHPFYAVVSDTSGHQYQTQTIWIRLIPSFRLSISSSPLVLSWPAIVGQSYDVLARTNLSSPPTVVASIVATNSSIEWPIPVSGASSSFYQVQLR